MKARRASIKETGEELTPAEWQRFDAAVAEGRGERGQAPSDPPDEPTRLPDEEERGG